MTRLVSMLLTLIALVAAMGCGGLRVPEGSAPNTALTPAKIRLALLNRLPDASHGFFYSSEYLSVEPAQVAALWRASGLRPPEPGSWRMCGQFSREFAAYAVRVALRAKMDRPWAIGQWGINGHAMNCFVDHAGRLWLLEPQTGAIRLATPKDRALMVLF